MAITMAMAITINNPAVRRTPCAGHLIDVPPHDLFIAAYPGSSVHTLCTLGSGTNRKREFQKDVPVKQLLWMDRFSGEEAALATMLGLIAA